MLDDRERTRHIADAELAEDAQVAALDTCGVCGLEYQQTLSHGAVDCFGEFRYRVAVLAAERDQAVARAGAAEATLREVRKGTGRMTLVGRSHTQRRNVPRHPAAPSWPLRDLTDAELSEAFDMDAEEAHVALHGPDSPYFRDSRMFSGSTSPRTSGARGRNGLRASEGSGHYPEERAA